MRANHVTPRRTFLLQSLALAGSTGCGYFLYPERKGASSGRVDVGVLILDLLWLLPGLVPGVIALAVDFSTGCIYESGGRSGKDDQPPPHRSLTAEVAIDGEIVADGRMNDEGRLELTWRREVDAADLRARAELTITGPDGALATSPLHQIVPA